MQCGYCKNFKSIKFFALSKSENSGRQRHCRECVKKFRSMSKDQLLGIKKVCSQCKNELDIINFNTYKLKSKSDARRPFCKECGKKYRPLTKPY
jgi:hypothetical protein